MPEYRLNEMPAQLPMALVEKLMHVETSTVGEVRHFGFVDRGIQPVLRRKRVAGTAVTLALPGRDSTLLYHALGLLRPGDVLVIDRLGDDRHACWGASVTVAAKAAGAAAGIVDGPCADLAEIEDSDFPVWGRGFSPITTRINDLGGALNHPISCGGVPVRPGDAILADDSGVLVLAPEEAEAIADAALARQYEIKHMQDQVRVGERLGELTGASRLVMAGEEPRRRLVPVWSEPERMAS